MTLESDRSKVEIPTLYLQAVRLYLCLNFLVHQVRKVAPSEDFHKFKQENVCKLLSPVLGPFYHPFIYSSNTEYRYMPDPVLGGDTAANEAAMVLQQGSQMKKMMNAL